jgi:hypothetical protein
MSVGPATADHLWPYYVGVINPLKKVTLKEQKNCSFLYKKLIFVKEPQILQAMSFCNKYFYCFRMRYAAILFFSLVLFLVFPILYYG